MTNSNFYDFRNNEDLCKLLEQIKKEIRPLQKSRIFDACKNSSEVFKKIVQCEPFDADSHPSMTLEELSEIKINDVGEQQIDLKAIEKLFFGSYGFLKHKKIPDIDIVNKLVIPPRIILFKSTLGQSERPVNGSGRHRNYALQMLCAASGVEWSDIMKQRIWIDKTIVANNFEFEMAMVLSNGAQCRKQSRMELTSFNLTSAGISTDDAEQILDNRFNIKKAQWPDLFANLTMQYIPQHSQHCKKDYFNRARTGWYKTYRQNDIYKNILTDIYENQPFVLQSIAQDLGQNMHIIHDQEYKNNNVMKKLTHRINERIVDQICVSANLEKPTWQTKEELYKKKLEQNLQQRELLEKQKEKF
jgi:hypothetical protein